MKFKNIPLFGQDSSPQNTSNILALGGTAFLWVVFLLCMIFVKPKVQKPKYKEIQIVLTPENQQAKQTQKEQSVQEVKQEQIQKTESANQPVQKTEAPKVPQKTPAQPSAKTPAQPSAKTTPKENVQNNSKPKVAEQPKTQQTPKQVQQPKTQQTQTPQTPQPVAQKTEPVEYAKSVEELMAEQMTSKKQQKEFDWDSMFDDSDETESFQNDSYEQTKKIQQNTENVQSSFSGAAGIAAENTSSAVKSETSQKQDVQQKTSSQTTSSLERIMNTSFVGQMSNGVQSQTNIQTSVSNDGHVKLQMSNGHTRSLLEPSEPKIILSQNAASTIDGSRTVKIRFKVVESGNVPVNEIQITPASMLTQIVRNEIIEQISKWRFESADYVAFAEFDYKIIKQ